MIDIVLLLLRGPCVRPYSVIKCVIQSLTKAIIFELFYYINGYFRVCIEYWSKMPGLPIISINFSWAKSPNFLIMKKSKFTFLFNICENMFLLSMRILERVQPFCTSFKYWDFYFFPPSYVVTKLTYSHSFLMSK